MSVMLFAVPVLGQANSGKAVIYIGGSYNKAMVDDAQNGFFGIDMFAGKMITNELCLGISSGYDIVHNYKYTVSSDPDKGGGDFTETLSVIPVLLKARYYFSINRMMQVNVQAGAGVYKTISRLGGNSVGRISGNETRPGGSIGIAFDYWFLLTTGVSFEFEYHAFTMPGGGTVFKFWQARVDYGIIKF